MFNKDFFKLALGFGLIVFLGMAGILATGYFDSNGTVEDTVQVLE